MFKAHCTKPTVRVKINNKKVIFRQRNLLILFPDVKSFCIISKSQVKSFEPEHYKSNANSRTK